MGALTSLRAQRSNPIRTRATGFLRRKAPRNDGILRAFAPWREPNLFLFSREDAKTRRVQGIYRPGSNIVECAADVLRLLRHNMPPVGE
jgi:hypothetical protein